MSADWGSLGSSLSFIPVACIPMLIPSLVGLFHGASSHILNSSSHRFSPYSSMSSNLWPSTPALRRWLCSIHRRIPAHLPDTSCHTRHKSENSAIPSLCRATPSATSEHLLTLRPACSPGRLRDLLHQRLQRSRCLHRCSDCYRVE